MKLSMLIKILFIAVWGCVTVYAAEPPALESVPDGAPELPAVDTTSLLTIERSAEDVTVRQVENETITEYRRNGRVYFVKIVADNGQAYYLMDKDGDGMLETRFYHREESVLNQWILWQW